MDTKTCSFDERKISSVAYGDSTLTDKIRVYLHKRKCANCSALYLEYRKTASAFESIKPEKCPASVTNRVEEKIGLKNEGNRGLFYPLLDFVFYRPSYALSGTAVVAILAIALTLQLTDIRSTGEESYYTESEIQQAGEQIEKTFAMIFPVVQDAQVNVREKIIKSQIIPPVQHSMEQTNKLFNKGFQQQ